MRRSKLIAKYGLAEGIDRFGSTDIHIVSDHGNEYTLQLREVSGEDDTHFDSKVFIASSDKAARYRLTQSPA